MIYIVDNFFPILAATLAGLAFGFVWSGMMGGDRGAAAPPRGHLAISFAAEFWLACILAGALILAPPEAGEWVMALGTPVVIWIGFVVPVLVVTLRRMGVAPRPILREAGHWVGVMLLQATVMQTIGLTAPAGA